MSSGLVNLNEGSVKKNLIKYALPVVAGSVLQALYSIADMYVVSRYVGSSGMSAVTNGSQVMNVFTCIAIGISNGGTILVGQYFGSGDREKRQQAVGTFLTMGTVFGAISLLILFFGAGILMKWMDAPALAESVIYLRICAIGAFATVGYNFMTAVLRAVGNSKAPMKFVIVSVVTNIFLDFLFVAVFNWREAGAAAATVISQFLSFALAGIYFLKQKELIAHKKGILKIRGKYVKMLLKLGVPSAFQMTVSGLSWLTVTFLLNKYGLDVSAASGVANKIKELCQLFSSSLSIAAGSMIAQTIGAGLYDRALKVMRTAMAMAVAIALVLIGIVEIFAPQLAGIFAGDDSEVLTIAVENLRIEILGQIFYAIFLVYHSMMLGAGHTGMMLLSSFVNCVVFRMVLAILFSRYWGATGIFWACMIAPATSVPIGFVYVRSKKWQRRIV